MNNAKKYWDDRYKNGGNSGSGSTGKLLEWKIETINNIVSELEISSICDIGCGDGKLSNSFEGKDYKGYDISEEAIKICKEKYPSISFNTLDSSTYIEPAELSMSIDVIFHCTTESEIINHLHILNSSKKYILIYGYNHKIEPGEIWAPHYQPSDFLRIIKSNFKNWKLIKKINQNYPVLEYGKNKGSLSDFYLFEKLEYIDKELSIIIPYHNEEREFILECINQVKDTIDISKYEIIVIDDCSKIPLEPIDDVTIIRHGKNTGVGSAFDTGVEVAKYENLFLCACDIRFVPNKWASKMISEIEKNQKSLICTTCVGLNENNMDFEKRRLTNAYNGATILIFHDKISNPLKEESFRSIIEAKWLPKIKDRDVSIVDIPCILGAAYGVSKNWYKYIDGFCGHRLWGTLEPYISIKSWLFGGDCKIALDIETAHIFKKNGTHGTPSDILIYNKIMIATMLFNDYQRLIDFLGTNMTIKAALNLYKNNKDFIFEKKEEYKQKTVFPMEAFLQKFRIDYRKT